VRVLSLAEVRHDEVRVVGGIEVEIEAPLAQRSNGIDRDAAVAR
jgi:hypothetical protein